MSLQLNGLFTSGLALSFLQSENCIVKQLAEGIVEEFADGHLHVFVGVFNIFQHFAKHVFCVTRLGTFIHFFLLFTLSVFVLRIELNFS
jgi:hypothetical protein